jgi:hypothetical protein
MTVAVLRRPRHVFRTRLSEHPSLYLPVARRRYPGPSPEVIGRETELVIDGYTRSATTFAVYALQLAQVRPVRLAHHLHAPAQLIEAAKRGVPALALIREPEGAVLSHVAREPWVDMRDAADGYARFYGCLMPYRSHFVVGEFEQVTHDFATVVRNLNDHFNLALNEFEPTEANMTQCFDLMKERPLLSQMLLGFESGTVTLDELQAERRRARKAAATQAAPVTSSDSNAWVPSQERSKLKDALRDQWRARSMTTLRLRAEAAYREFVAPEAAFV